MIRKRKYLFRKPPLAPRIVAVLLALLAGAAVVFLLPRPSATVSARMDGAGADRALVIEVEPSGNARRFDVPSLSIARQLDGRKIQVRVPAADLPAEGTNLAYVVRGPWYSADHDGEIDLESRGSEVNYVARVKPDGAGGAWLTITGEAGNHVLLFDPAGKVAVSGRHADLAGADGKVRVRFSAPEMNEAQREDGPTTARLSVTAPTGEVSDHEIVLRDTPTATVNARLLFPPPGASTERSVVRVRILTEPGALVRFGDGTGGLAGPRVEYDWPIPRGGKHTLSYEVRAPGLKPARGTVEIERVGKDEAAPGENEAAPISLTDAVLARDVDSLAGQPVEIAGEILARPAPIGSLELIEIGPGGGGRGEVGIVYQPDAVPPLRAGDRVIARGRVEGTQRLRTAAGRVRNLPKVRATEVLIRSQAESAEAFESRYASLVASFWRGPDAGEEALPVAPPTVRVFASADPWPEPPPAQPRQPVLASERVSGLGDDLPPERLARPEPAPAPGPAVGDAGPPGVAKPEEPAAPAAVARPAPAETPQPAAEAPAEPGAGEEAQKPAPTGDLVRVPRAPDPEARERYEPAPTVMLEEGPVREQPGMIDAPKMDDVPGAVALPEAREKPATPPEWTWTRDRRLESELAGRGVGGVRILRRGRSIRLRGEVDGDAQLRTLYQFMNDKGFGEVDYGVEVR